MNANSAPLPASPEPSPVFGPAGSPPPPVISTNAILTAMLQVAPRVSDLIFSPGRLPQVEVNGELLGVKVGNLPVLSATDTTRIATDILAGNQKGINLLRDQGACDVSYSIAGKSRFRVNIFDAAGYLRHRDAGHPGRDPQF